MINGIDIRGSLQRLPPTSSFLLGNGEVALQDFPEEGAAEQEERGGEVQLDAFIEGSRLPKLEAAQELRPDESRRRRQEKASGEKIERCAATAPDQFGTSVAEVR